MRISALPARFTISRSQCLSWLLDIDPPPAADSLTNYLCIRNLCTYASAGSVVVILPVGHLVILRM